MQEARAEEESEAEEEVADGAVEASRDERPHRHEERVVVLLVEERAGRGSGEHRGHACKQDEQQDRLGAGRDILGIVVPQSEEHRPRAHEHRRHTEPPRPVRRELDGGVDRVGGHPGSVAAGD